MDKLFCLLGLHSTERRYEIRVNPDWEDGELGAFAEFKKCWVCGKVLDFSFTSLGPSREGTELVV